MNEEILKLIYDYSSNGKIADNYFIERLVNIVVSFEQLYKYVNIIEYIPVNIHDNSAVSGYKYNGKKIIIFYEKLNNYLSKKKSTDLLISENEKIFYKNVKVTDCILHELEHAKQSKIIEEENTIESQILNLTGVGKSLELIALQLKKIGFSNSSINIFLEEKMKIYFKYYDFAPQERLAEINSHSKMIDILYPIKRFVPNIYNIEKLFVIKNKLKGYTLNNKLISPTVLYLKEQGEESGLNNFSWYDNEDKKCLQLSKKLYNTEKRVRLGLPIDRFEHFNLKWNLEKAVYNL